MNRLLSLSVWTALLLGLTACNKPAETADSGKGADASASAPAGGKKRKRSVEFERDTAGKIIGAMIAHEDESGPRRERVAVRRGANGRIAGAEIEDLDD